MTPSGSDVPLLGRITRFQLGKLGAVGEVPSVLRELVETGLVHPIRPDKLALIAREFVRWGVSPATIFFSDRPQRIAGHIGTDEFVELWSEGEDSFEQDPPNAVLAFVESGAKSPNDVVITITTPRLEANDLSYAIKILEGRLP